MLTIKYLIRLYILFGQYCVASLSHPNPFIVRESANSSDLQRANTACFNGRNVFGQTHSGSGPARFLDASYPAFTERIDVNWSDNCWENSTCIFIPNTTQEVSDALQIVTSAGSKFSVRSGGHNFNVHSSSISTGVLIDLSQLNHVSLASSKETVSIGPASSFGEVYQALNGSGVSLQGTKNTAPSAGGVILGGGNGYFASLVGMASNNLRSIEIVLANSSIVRASLVENEDLFWAVKGGGPNFGIITSYTMETIPVDLLWFEVLLFDRKYNDALLQATVGFQEAAEGDDYANLIFQISPTATLVGFIYAKPVVQPPVFQMFSNIPHSSALVNSTIGTELQLAQIFDEPAGTPMRHSAVSQAHQTDIKTYRESYASYLNLVDQVTELGGTLTYGIQTFSSNAVRKTLLNGGTPLNLTPVSQNWFVGTVTWADSNNDSAAVAALMTLSNTVTEIATRNGVYLPFKFMNDANQVQNVFQGYGLDSFERLSLISKKYDPDQVFQNLQNGGWLLSKSKLFN